MTLTRHPASWLWIPTVFLALLGACTDEAVLVAADGGTSGGTGGTGATAGAGGSAAGSGGSAGSSAGTGGSAGAGGNAGTGGNAGSAGAGTAGSAGSAGAAGTGGTPGNCAPVTGLDMACDMCMATECASELADCEDMNDCSCKLWSGEVGQMNCMFKCATFRPVPTDYEQCYDACGKDGLPNPKTVALIECIAEGGGGQPPKCPTCFIPPGQ